MSVKTDLAPFRRMRPKYDRCGIPGRYRIITAMHILLISSKGRGTGCILRARGIAKALRQEGHRVTLLPPFPTLPFWFDMALDMPWYFLAGLFVKADLVMGFKPYPTLVPALAWQKWIHGAKVAIDVDDLDYAYSGGLFSRLHRALQVPWPRRADLVTYHNPNLRGPLIDVFSVEPSRLVPLGQGIDPGTFRPFKPSPSDLPPPVRPLVPQDPTSPSRVPRGALLVHAAHLNGACGLSEILESMSEILQKRPDARLLVVGGGPDERRFRALARCQGLADRVIFTGQVTPREVAACLNVADLTLVYYGPGPSSEHRSSMKLREALACRARIVATAVGETPRFARHVHLSDPNPTAFAQAVLAALKSRPKPALPSRALAALNWSSCIGPLSQRIRPS